MIEESDFYALEPEGRGCVVYMFGSRDDEPNVPDEENPYTDLDDRSAWEQGQFLAMMAAQDSP